MALRAKKRQSREVVSLLVAIVLPLAGNLMIMTSGNEFVSYIGYLVYFIGLDLTVLAMILYTAGYCSISISRTIWFKVIIAFVVIDVVQLLANYFTGHAFAMSLIDVDGEPYYALVPYAGQYFHRLVAYGMFFVSVAIFAYKTITVPNVYKERFGVILASMVVCGALETYYIFSRTPIDRSMIAFGLYGLLIFYFTLYYRPMRLLDRMLSRVVSSFGEMLVFFDAENRCIYANEAAKVEFEMFEESDLENAEGQISKSIGMPLQLDREWSKKRMIGQEPHERYWVVESRHLKDSDGKMDGSVFSMRDVTVEENKLLREKHLASHDRLTGLYNKECIYEKAREMIKANPGESYYAVAIDVKDFKIINDIFSKDFGDQVLLWMAGRLRQNATENEVYGRISGDKFAFIIPAAEFDAEAIERRLSDNNFSYKGIMHPIIIHMGVYAIEDTSMRISVMLDRAFMAISTIKSDYNKHVAYYDAEMRENAIWSQEISAELEGALADGQIIPYLQPLVDANGNVAGAEVLVRWQHPEEGFLSPARFIPVFEANGMIARLDSYMWECACKILSDWERRGIDLFLSVNISPKDFYFIDVYETIRKLVERYGINPAKLRLEITETVMMSDIDNRLRILEDLQSYGFIVEMDDFGSGYSSLNMLKDIPVDVLKIDMMFLYKTKDQDKAQTILKTIINLTDQLGIPSITEGVETADQFEMLISLGCNLFQGYYFAKPMPVDEFEESYRAA